jgi:hypothetical protein
MEVLIGNLNLKSISKKKQLSLLKSEGRDHLRKNHMLVKSRRVSGANAVPIGSKKHHLQSMIHIILRGLRRMIIFIIGMHYNSCHPSVFQRIEWPRNRVISNHMHRRNHSSSRPKNKDVKSNERGLNFQILKHNNKGKEPMGPEPEFWAYEECAASGLPRIVCSQGSVCSRCNKKYHTSLHCIAQWHPTNRRLDASLGNRAANAKNMGASTSKNLQSNQRVDPLPSSSRDALPSPLGTDLNLAPPPEQSPSPERHRQASPFTSQAHAQGSSALPGSMAYQRADPAPFAMFGFHAMEVQHM